MAFQIGRTVYEKELLPMHQHKNYELIAYIQGTGRIYTATGTFPVQAGKIVIVPPGIRHRSIPERELQSVSISGDFSGIFHFDEPVLLSDNAAGEGTALVRMLDRNRYENSDYLAALCNALTHFLLRNLTMEDAVGLAVNRIVYEITHSFYDHDIDLNGLLNRSGYAEDYIRSHFKRITGKTPTEFLHGLRIKRACYLMEVYRSTMSLSEISAQCGYTDYSFFSKKFKFVTGVSPREYKNTLQT